MADAPHIPDETETRARWGSFEWTPANAIKVIMSSAFNAPAVLMFLFSGKVWWGFSLTLMAASILGGYGGAWLAQRVPARWVRRFAIGVGTCMTAYYFWNVYGRGV